MNSLPNPRLQRPRSAPPRSPVSFKSSLPSCPHSGVLGSGQRTRRLPARGGGQPQPPPKPAGSRVGGQRDLESCS